MASTALSQMASIRYFDWVITTPTMLLTTIIYFKYQEHIEKDKDRLTTSARSQSPQDRLTFWNFIKENKQNIILIFVSNFLMLVFGYLGEIQVISMGLSLLFGFIFFGYTFYIIYIHYAINSKQSQKLFYFILFIWALYGVAAIQNVENKNNMFNILDIFAKNFFGIYLYIKILSVKKSTINN
jgi:bacteriorhodopsin